MEDIEEAGNGAGGAGFSGVAGAVAATGVAAAAGAWESGTSFGIAVFEVFGVQLWKTNSKETRKMKDLNISSGFGILNIIKFNQIGPIIIQISGSSSGVEH